jgi:hypothetical protein
MRWAACKGKRKSVYRVLVGKPEEKNLLETPWRKWEDNTRKCDGGHGLDSSGLG